MKSTANSPLTKHLRIKAWPAMAVLACMAACAAQAQTPAPAPAAATPAAATPATPAATPDPMKRMAEVARIRREAGLKICRDSADGKLQYQGFVQGDENGYLKVQIGAEIDKATNTPVPNFQAVNIWDSVNNWSICPE